MDVACPIHTGTSVTEIENIIATITAVGGKTWKVLGIVIGLGLDTPEVILDPLPSTLRGWTMLLKLVSLKWCRDVAHSISTLNTQTNRVH